MAARSVCASQEALVAAARQLKARNDDAWLLLLLLTLWLLFALWLLFGRRRSTWLGRAGFGLRLRLCFRLRLLRSGFLRCHLRRRRGLWLRRGFRGSRFGFRCRFGRCGFGGRFLRHRGAGFDRVRLVL